MRPRRTVLAGALLGFGFLVATSWWRDAQPLQVADAPASSLPCISYAPSRTEGPSRRGVTLEQLRGDLELLARQTSCIRTYTVSEGFDAVPAVAEELGLQVLLGLWISRDAEHNEKELALGIRTARAHEAAVRAIVVGNEVLLRQDLPPEKLAVLIRRVSRATGLPVTYADVWGFWLDHRWLAAEVSFVTVHILPYWNDDPLGIDDVLRHVDELYSQLHREFRGHELFIGETGWPSAGRPRGAAVPSRVNQARYLREFTKLAQERGFDFNVIEAFDQPWKIPHEGTVGGHWGIYDGARQPKFPWTGPVVESPEGRTVFHASLLAGLLFALAGAMRTKAARLDGALAWATFGVLAVGIGMRQWQFLSDGNVSWLDWSVTLTICAIGWAMLLIATRALVPGPAAALPIPRWLSLPLLLSCAHACLGLVFAGRHRDFPLWLFLPGAIAMVAVSVLSLSARGASIRSRTATEEVVLATWLLVAGLLIPLLERLHNPLANAWSLASVLLAVAILLPTALQSREHHRASQHPDRGPGEGVEHHSESAERDGHAGDPGPSPPQRNGHERDARDGESVVEKRLDHQHPQAAPPRR
jgi:glucan 1,3-beta-glucosidase